MKLTDKYLKTSLNEASASSRIEKELKTLITKIKKGSGIDSRSFDEYTDGELLAMLLNGVFQSALLDLDDRKGFKKNFRF